MKAIRFVDRIESNINQIENITDTRRGLWPRADRPPGLSECPEIPTERGPESARRDLRRHPVLDVLVRHLHEEVHLHPRVVRQGSDSEAEQPDLNGLVVVQAPNSLIFL